MRICWTTRQSAVLRLSNVFRILVARSAEKSVDIRVKECFDPNIIIFNKEKEIISWEFMKNFKQEV